MYFSDALVEFVKPWEGLKLEPSPDRLVPSKIDVGYGHVLLPGEERRPITVDEADELLRWDLYIVNDGVNSLVAVQLEQRQHDALCAFAYNVGLDIDDDNIAEGLGDSTLLRRVNEGNLDAAAAQFTLWVHANHSNAIVPGLLKRRLAEQAMFVNGDYSGRP